MCLLNIPSNLGAILALVRAIIPDISDSVKGLLYQMSSYNNVV